MQAQIVAYTLTELVQALLQLCTVQAQNGTAADALLYRPQGFHTNITEPQPYEYQY